MLLEGESSMSTQPPIANTQAREATAATKVSATELERASLAVGNMIFLYRAKLLF